jgi:acetyl-CoA acyltransferase
LNKLKPVFAAGGSVTAGNSSQTSDGAAFVVVMSERLVNDLGLKPVARMMSYATAGVDPRIMGIGPVAAVPLALKQAGLKLADIQQVELNEAFAAQALAVIQELGIDPEMVNPNGGAIALGHALGSTGARLSVQLFNEMKRRDQKYGMVTACVGGGQGVAGIYERLN